MRIFKNLLLLLQNKRFKMHSARKPTYCTSLNNFVLRVFQEKILNGNSKLHHEMCEEVSIFFVSPLSMVRTKGPGTGMHRNLTWSSHTDDPLHNLTALETCVSATFSIDLTVSGQSSSLGLSSSDLLITSYFEYQFHHSRFLQIRMSCS